MSVLDLVCDTVHSRGNLNTADVRPECSKGHGSLTVYTCCEKHALLLDLKWSGSKTVVGRGVLFVVLGFGAVYGLKLPEKLLRPRSTGSRPPSTLVLVKGHGALMVSRVLVFESLGLFYLMVKVLKASVRTVFVLREMMKLLLDLIVLVV